MWTLAVLYVIIFLLCVATLKLRIKFVAHPQQECRHLQAVLCVLALFLASPFNFIAFLLLLSCIPLGFHFFSLQDYNNSCELY